MTAPEILMKRPAIFFDRDNTLIISDGYLGDPAQVELVAGAPDAIARARDLGYAVVVFSNQSGVARGLFTEDDVRAVNARLEELLRQGNRSAIIDRHEFCPFHPQAVLDEYRRDSDLRKPRPGMIHRAEQEMGLDLSRSWVIGDAPRDIEAGAAAGCRTILLSDPALPVSPAAQEPFTVRPDHTVHTLAAAIDCIEAVSEPVHQRVKAQPRDNRAAADDSAATTIIEPRRTLPPPAEPGPDLARLERLVEQILVELRRRRDEPVSDFSVPRLLAGIVQVVTIAAAFMSYLYRGTPTFQSLILLAIFLQTLTIGLLIMGRLR